MISTLELLRKRRSLPPHQLVEPGPNKAQIAELLELAARVPDHGKLAPWRFIVIEGDARHQLGEVAAQIVQTDRPEADAETMQREKGRFSRAPVVIALVSRARKHPKIPVWEQHLSAGAAAMNLLVASEAMGFSAVWVTEWCSFDRRMLDVLGLAADETMAGFIHIGTPSLPLDERTDKTRPVMAEIISYFGG
jgi:Nitroreductase